MLNGKKGPVKVQATDGGEVIAVLMQYIREAAYSIESLYGILAETPSGPELRGSYNTFLEQNCEMLITNPTESAVSVNFSLTRCDGTQIVKGENINIEPQSTFTYDACAREATPNYGSINLDIGTDHSIDSGDVFSIRRC